MTSQLGEPDVADAVAIARVHVRAWQAAYGGGLMPDEYLESLSVEERAVIWSRALQQPLRPRRARLVIEDDGGTIVGFILVGPAGGDHAATEGELFAINVDPDHWGTGAAAALHDAGMDQMRKAGFDRAVLWVHPKNARARRFYESHGWQSDDLERREDVMGVEVPEVRYSVSLAQGPSDEGKVEPAP
jgi:ribosomal protein S18 acetylase RimI-like enzyme